MKRLNLIIAAILLVSQICWSQQNRPNIILILTDDLDSRSIAHMPNLQALIADQGTTFSNYFVSVPLCCPSRASILRGQYAHNTQIFTNRPPNGGFEKFRDLEHENSTIATWLQAAGYRTALFGKYLNGYPDDQPTYIPKGWDEWYCVIDTHYYDYRINENGNVVQYGHQPEDYETDVLSRKVTDFIQRHKAAPFFIYLAPFAPHSPQTPAPRHQNAFPGAKAPRVPSFDEPNVSDKPQWLRNVPPLSNNDIQSIDKRYRERLQSLLAVDEMIKSIIDTLAANELANTYIFFTSDNGFHLGEHRIASGKDTPYDEATHVPLIVRGPNVPQAVALTHFTQNIDLAPTFAELAGATMPSFIDGRSLAPLLKNNPPPTTTWRQGALIEHGTNSANAGIPEFQALRTSDYLYVEYKTGEGELYELRNDPYQLRNRYDTADPTLIAQLAKQLNTLRQCKGGGCLITSVDEKDDTGLPSRFELMQNYPNPFGRLPFISSTTIRFALSAREHVTLKIFDLNGRELKTLVDGKLAAGEHNVNLNAANLPNGVYFYQIKTESFSQTRKAVLRR